MQQYVYSWLQGEVVPGLTWAMPCEDGMTVRSAQLRHRLECWGYVFQEASLPPTEKEDVVQRVGLKPGEALSQLTRSSSPSDTVQCKSEQPITFKDILNPPVVGRKVVLLGDTCDSTAIEGVALLHSIFFFQHHSFIAIDMPEPLQLFICSQGWLCTPYVDATCATSSCFMIGSPRMA